MVPAHKLPHEGSSDVTPQWRDLEGLSPQRLLLPASPPCVGPAMQDTGVSEDSAQVAPTPHQCASKAAPSRKKRKRTAEKERKRAADLDPTLLIEAIRISSSFAAAIAANMRDKQLAAAAAQFQDYGEPFQCDQAARQRVALTRSCYREFISLAKKRNQVCTYQDHPFSLRTGMRTDM
jgi:hypothetical protein